MWLLTADMPVFVVSDPSKEFEFLKRSDMFRVCICGCVSKLGYLTLLFQLHDLAMLGMSLAFL